MGTATFRFKKPELNEILRRAIQENGMHFTVTETGDVAYLLQDEYRFENYILNPIRSNVFSRWQILSCPRDYFERYLVYMRKRYINFEIEYQDGEPEFLIPGNYNPHRWEQL